MDFIKIRYDSPLVLNNVEFFGQSRNGSTEMAEYDHLKIVSGEYYSTISGSIPRYMNNGSNIITSDINEIKLAIEKLSDEFSLDISNSTITELDWTQNITVNHTPTTYYSTLGETRYYNRVPDRNTLYYNRGSGRRKIHVAKFYDKAREQKNNSLGNLLRYELKLQQDIKKMGIKFSQLTDPNIYNWLTQKWIETYTQINKVKEMRPSKITSQKDWTRYTESLTIALQGKDHVFKLFEEAYKSGDMDRNMKKNLRQRINNLEKNLSDPTELELEMNEKFEGAAQRAMV